jgi:hemoglobin
LIVAKSVDISNSAMVNIVPAILHCKSIHRNFTRPFPVFDIARPESCRSLGIITPMDDLTTLIYEKIGSDQPFYALVDAFYVGIEAEPLLRPMYPDDLTHAKEHLTLFLIQRFGGHTQYGELRGHPRLRGRHMPFQIGAAERDAWLRHMNAAIEATPEFHPFRDELQQYFTDSAEFLVNKAEPSQIQIP